MKKSLIGKVVIALALVLAIAGASSCKKDPGPGEVFIQDDAFSPATLTVSAGTTVTWTNKDGEDHTVTSDSTFFDSGHIANKKTYSFTFSNAGTYPYHCEIHSNMHGTVVVQ